MSDRVVTIIDTDWMAFAAGTDWNGCEWTFSGAVHTD